MIRANGKWELQVLEADPPIPMRNFHGMTVGDLDSDGHMEIIIGGHGGLLWYRPDTCERGVIAAGNDFTVGLVLEDVDGDGRLEIVTSEGHCAAHDWWITWYKPGRTLNDPWQRFVMDPACTGLPHDILFADLDGDGRREMVANAVFCPLNGVFIYAPGADVHEPWQRHRVYGDIHAEGLVVADLDGDGRLEIINGPDYFTAPADGPFVGEWQRTVYAPDMRDMGRVAVCDITGNGRPDIVFAESEYRDGKLSWFENRLREDPAHPWLEHELEGGLVFAHSLDLWPMGTAGGCGFFLAEMDEGGWSQPYNYDARLIRYITANRGRTWQRDLLDQGQGTHQALVVDIDGDGEPEIVGKGGSVYTWVHIWKHRAQPTFPVTVTHRFVDRDKPFTSIDVLAADVDGDGLTDVVSGAWWYRNPNWVRHEIPGIYQVIDAHDLDGDGRMELIAVKPSAAVAGVALEKLADGSEAWYNGLTSEICWLKPVDPTRGLWQEYPIGTGHGDWPHGALVAPLLPGGQLALVLCYHSAYWGAGSDPEIFAVPADPCQHPWPKRILAEIPYSENPVAVDINGNGRLDIAAGAWWLENLGNGDFQPHRIAPEGFQVAHMCVTDIDGDDRPDIVLGEPIADYSRPVVPNYRLAWFQNMGRDLDKPWPMHVIDRARYIHSIAAYDFDGDGEIELVAGEHDPIQSYRTRCRLFAYKKADPQGLSWRRTTIDGRFEHHCGGRLISLGEGRMGILSIAWKEGKYVHLYEVQRV